MAAPENPDPEEVILYSKDPSTKIATLTFNRPERLNAPTINMRRYYGSLLHKANADDDVKVLVIRGEGNDLGSGADLPEVFQLRDQGHQEGFRRETGLVGVDDVTVPPMDSYRAGGTIAQFYTNPAAGNRSLQDFKKVSIIEAKGYCYGWHFYQAGDADIVVASDDALFGHAAFRYAGWGPRMWAWIMTMGLRRFQEMVFTGRPFTAQEMYDCNFVNSVVPRADLEAETERYAMACARTRPTDTVFMQKTFFEIYKQYQGEMLGSILTGMLEMCGPQVHPDAEEELVMDSGLISSGLAQRVKQNDDLFPPEWRLSRSGRKRTE